ncbi:MAG TPA: hypothetical protein VKS81_11305 [Bacteroidota bacterium]|nr:hypothetical protein [Bacteroidota bacterium]
MDTSRIHEYHYANRMKENGAKFLRLIAAGCLGIVLCSTALIAQPTATDGGFYDMGVVGDVGIASAGGSVTGLSKGVTYTLNPDNQHPSPSGSPYIITPIINGSETGTPMIFTITVIGANAVTVTFQLPPTLVSVAEEGQLQCVFSSTSGYRDGTADGLPAANGNFNPNVTNTFSTGNAGGTITLNIGITVIIPATASTGTYQGVVSCTASITGM